MLRPHTSKANKFLGNGAQIKKCQHIELPEFSRPLSLISSGIHYPSHTLERNLMILVLLHVQTH
jgi:hypothetical protein